MKNEIKGKKEVKNKVYEDATINIDGYHFEGCTFKRCVIETNRGEFNLVSCGFEGCRLSLGGNALSIAILLKMFFGDRPIFFEEKVGQDLLAQAFTRHE